MLKRYLNVMWLMIDAVVYLSFSHHNANFSQTELSSLDESEILKMMVNLSSVVMRVVRRRMKKRKW